ncbi:hypothetical protein QQG55_44205 [Brugia pahangi]
MYDTVTRGDQLSSLRPVTTIICNCHYRYRQHYYYYLTVNIIIKPIYDYELPSSLYSCSRDTLSSPIHHSLFFKKTDSSEIENLLLLLQK